MKSLKLIFAFLLLCAPCMLVGCSSSTEPTVVEVDETMTAEEEAQYEEDSMGSADDTAQN